MAGRIVTFYLGGNLFGIDISAVREAVRNVSYTPVPGSESYIAGLMNMRGQVVTLFNTNKVLGNEYDNDAPGTSCIILKSKLDRPDYAGFLVEKLGEVLNLRDEWCQLPPENVKGMEKRFISGLIKIEDGLVILIEPDSIISEFLAE